MNLMQPDRFVLHAIGGLTSVILVAFVLSSSSSALAQGRTPEGRPVPEASLGDAHAVRPGDTLWDLCAKYLNSPWYWPKIWSYNPQLTNPHWIYPGNEIRFYPGDEALPTEIGVGQAINVSDDDLAIPGLLTEDELVQTVGTIEAGRTPDDSVWTSFMGFVSKDAMKRFGEISNASPGTILLSDFDRIYIRGRKPMRQGDRMAIFRADREIIHPITGESYGYAVELIGGVEIIDTNPRVSTGRIYRSYRPVSRGDVVGPFPENFKSRVEPVPNSGSAKGYVLETTGDVLGPLGEYNMVYVDRGRKHGVQVGNTFVVYQRGDRYTGQRGGLPNEIVGTLMVLDARDEASTAIVIASAREVMVGDKVEMLPGR